MFFRRTEGKRWRPGFAITVGALAALGVASITEKTKKWFKDKWKKACSVIKEDEE